MSPSFRSRAPLLFALLGLAPAMLQAEVFKCVSPEGRVSYTDSPCAKGAARAANISNAVGECANAECEAQRAQQAAAARRQLQEEKEALSEMVQQRRRAEAEYAEERARLAEAQRLASLEQKVDMLLVQGNQPLYPAYPIFPISPPCTGLLCAGRPTPPGILPGPMPPGQMVPKPLPVRHPHTGTSINTSPRVLQP